MTWLRFGATATGLLLLMAPTAQAADKDAIQKAIDRSVTYLKQIQRDDGTWAHEEIGATALAGLTLLECGVPPDDKVIKKATQAIRQGCISTSHTYSVSLALLYLDRLGDPADVPLIQSLATRLLAGQNLTGGWNYHCPQVPDAEVQRLTKLLKQEVPQKPDDKPKKPELPKEIQQLLKIINQVGYVWGEGNTGDNSNTQFATLALWVARRHGLPVDRALGRVEARFRGSQGIDGGWGYGYAPKNQMVREASTAAMTCAGLLGLGVSYGVALDNAEQKDPKGAKPKRDPAKDPAIRNALAALGTAIDHPAAKKKGKPQVLLLGRAAGRTYYFLWSLERVAMAYGLETIGDKDWYGWGTEILLANQQQDGSWHGDFPQGGADTCFALLFLRRANLARDLSANLKGKVQDPFQTVLKAGGVGGDNLPKMALKPAIDPNEKPSDKPKKDGSYADKSTPPPPLDAKDKPTPTEQAAAEAARLGADLVRAEGARQDLILDRLRDAKGGAYTQELAQAIAQLKGEAKNKAREALAERLTRMTADTLNDKLEDEHLEIRRAAALACAMKEEKVHIPKLIDLLKDPEPAVARAAQAALKSLTEKDFGPAANATPGERDKAVAEWKAWWSKQGRK